MPIRIPVDDRDDGSALPLAARSRSNRPGSRVSTDRFRSPSATERKSHADTRNVNHAKVTAEIRNGGTSVRSPRSPAHPTPRAGRMRTAGGEDAKNRKRAAPWGRSPQDPGAPRPPDQ